MTLPESGENKTDLKSMSFEELAAFTDALGEKAYRTGQLFDWIHQKNAASFEEMTTLSKALRGKLEKEASLTSAVPVRVLTSQKDGTRKYLFRLDCTTVNGETERIAVNRGTLMLEEITQDYLNYPSVTTCFQYTQEPPVYDFLKGWEKPLRTVTVLRESFESGEQKTQTDVLRLPADWEYLPYEGRWGNYTIYMDAGYTKPYAYPGDGVDYTLYMTTAKG